jgi:hypothetical protein
MRRRMKRCKRGCSLGWPPGKERFWPENASLTAGQHEPAIRSPAGERFAAQTARISIAACAACQFREGSYASGEARSKKCRRFDERSGRRNFDVGLPARAAQTPAGGTLPLAKGEGRSRLNRGRAWSSTFTLASGNQVLPNEIGDLTAPPESPNAETISISARPHPELFDSATPWSERTSHDRPTKIRPRCARLAGGMRMC